ncbi:hypothetical protein [Streptomyces sp. NPDC126514]|uniref:hypothetical protein n=1 Tax=Streptomyces sp. NPDC126514 TaxID=3155210 RepID=UPI00331C7C29
MGPSRHLGNPGTRILFDDERVRVWELRLAPGERSDTHHHQLDHLLIQINGDRIAVEPEPDSQGPFRTYLEAPVTPGAVLHVPHGGIETAHNTGSDPYLEIIVELKK